MLPMMKTNSYYPSIFDEFFSTTPMNRCHDGKHTPRVNISENEKSFQIDLAAPGMEKDDFKIEVKDDVLTISTEKKEEKTEEGKNYKRREFSYSAFSRSFILPELTDSENIAATYRNGVLEVSIPKKEAEASKAVRTINIQ